MKLSAQEEYGLRCLLQVAKRGCGGCVTIPEISQAEGLSAPNVAKMMRLLRSGGLVKSIRGKSGGFTLTSSARNITLAEVLKLLGGPLYCPAFCEHHSGDEETCAHQANCSVRPVWRRLQETVAGILEQVTLRDLLGDEDETACVVDFLPAATPALLEHR